MRKMSCLFERDFTDKRRPILLDRVTPGCEWVTEGLGVASVKWDGTACAVIGGVLHARYDAKRGKPAPANGIPCEPEPDPVTGHWPHWVPVGDEPQFKWHREAWGDFAGKLDDGTYELCGPKISANPEGLYGHILVPHGGVTVEAPRTFAGLRDFLADFPNEGLVFRHGDLFAKIRRADFGFPWPLRGRGER